MTTSNMVQARGDFRFVEMNHIFLSREGDEGTISKEDGEGSSFLIVKAQRRRLCGEDVAKTEPAWEGEDRCLRIAA
ncbi:hypothetical protein YC2023_049733 [Brassica napus]